ncbi:MAG: hypothetical protein EXR76_16105 [Myxococcales bacterium]|nr:hypothetical protein [Myxococcales bacterium]
MRRFAVALGFHLLACGEPDPAREAPEEVVDVGQGLQDRPTDAPAQSDASPPSDTSSPPDARAGCGDTTFAYDPLSGATLQTFPDDFYTALDPSRPTGLRISLSGELAPWVDRLPGNFASVFRQLETLDGWGTTAGIVLRFTGPLGPIPDGAVRLLVQGEEGGPEVPLDVPFEIQTADEGATLILWPMVPLRPETQYGVVVGEVLTDAAGDCLSTNETLTSLLDGTASDPRLERLLPRYAALLESAGQSPQGVRAAVVFTTQSIEVESQAIAADIVTHDFSWSTPPTCVDAPLYRICDGAFRAADYRGAEGYVADGTPQLEYELPVRAWLPLGQPGPFPVTIFGHGLGSGKEQGDALAEVAAPMGMATVAIDAPSHGLHPTATATGDLLQIMDFFGINILAQRLDALVLRDHWRESTYDKLQLIRLLNDDGDLDGDGASDVDPSRLSYFGVSLGGIMGPELLALSDDLGAGVLSVPGGRVASIISDAPQFEILIRAMTPPGTPPGEVARFFPVLQTLLDRGDAANYGPRILSNRLTDGPSPHLLFAMAINDEIVPNVCNRALARAIGVPHVAPVLQEVGIIGEAPPTPFSGNLDDGQTTAGLFQFDHITRGEGRPPEVAEHSNVPSSREGILQATHFLKAWIETGLPEIINPLDVLGTPPLPASEGR